LNVTELLAGAVKTALHAAALPAPEAVAWEIPREAGHGDYATNVAMTLARQARRPPRQVAEAIVKHLPALPAIERVEIAGPGFLNVFLAPQWCAEALREILLAGEGYGQSDLGRGRRYRIEFVSANPTGPLIIVNARAAAVGDALARILRSQGFRVECQYYVNDAGTQFQALAASMEVRLRQALGESAELPENAYPGEYLVDLAQDYLARDPIGARAVLLLPAGERLERLGRLAVDTMVAAQRRVLEEYGTAFDRWTYEAADVRAAGLPERAIDDLRAADFIYEEAGALWFRATTLGDDKDRVLRKSDGDLTYFAVDIGFHHFGKFAEVDCVIDLLGPDHHGYIPRLKAAMTALGHPEAAFDVLIVQLVTLLRDGQPVRMSKRRGEFVLMEELLEEVGRDAARFTFLTRRHDSPLEFDLAVATRQSADNPVFYVQYAHARVTSLFRTAAQQGVAVPPWGEVDFGRLDLPEEQTIIKRLLQYPELVAGAARAREPHRIAYYLSELAGIFHPYYKAHRILTEDRPLSLARLGLCAAVGQVVRSGLGLLGVSAPESM
ncbi:MAG: arginine--tRNA ligase, partial [Candidatus Rokubacteria bacterium]|nr:arginine--tRNA ligase [Candidatus Rokubacteria bacterium]